MAIRVAVRRLLWLDLSYVHVVCGVRARRRGELARRLDDRRRRVPAGRAHRSLLLLFVMKVTYRHGLDMSRRRLEVARWTVNVAVKLIVGLSRLRWRVAWLFAGAIVDMCFSRCRSVRLSASCFWQQVGRGGLIVGRRELFALINSATATARLAAGYCYFAFHFEFSAVVVVVVGVVCTKRWECGLCLLGFSLRSWSHFMKRYVFFCFCNYSAQVD